ncbi:MAG: DNA replication/repair protein RecF [Chthoniobacterales bacterium]|jgi:DNA replication and repair protein RecF|nr:DNA replication/repair protein RecF [Chthoniobacterales bacterium]
MLLESIDLHDFRCFRRAEFLPSPGLNLISAPNASGKSSLLEAICVLLRLQSPRAGALAETIKHGSAGFTLSGRAGERGLKCHLSREEGRKLLLDDVPQRKSGEYLRVGLVAFFCNEDIELVRGTSSKRRRFLDFLGSQCDAGYLKNLRAYERALRSRNFLLKEGAHRARELSAYDGPLIAAGQYLAATRARLCAELAPIVAGQVGAISTRDESTALHYVCSGGPDLAAALAESAAEERRLRQTVIGPHRDDISLELDGAAASSFASEGQQRTLSLALRLAQADLIRTRRGAPPVYLLDDIFGELDPDRRRRLLLALPPDSQRILTTTTWQWLGDEATGQPQHWRIEDSRVIQA